MSQIQKHEDHYEGVLSELHHVASSLNMPDDPVEPPNPHADYISQKYRYAQHAMEHLYAAIDEMSKVFQEREAWRGATWKKRIEMLEEANRQMNVRSTSYHKYFNKFKDRCKMMLLESVQVAESLVRILTLYYYQPGWHCRMLFSEFMENVE